MYNVNTDIIKNKNHRTKSILLEVSTVMFRTNYVNNSKSNIICYTLHLCLYEQVTKSTIRVIFSAN